jgi:hypothetical protein
MAIQHRCHPNRRISSWARQDVDREDRQPCSVIIQLAHNKMLALRASKAKAQWLLFAACRATSAHPSRCSSPLLPKALAVARQTSRGSCRSPRDHRESRRGSRRGRATSPVGATIGRMFYSGPWRLNAKRPGVRRFQMMRKNHSASFKAQLVFVLPALSPELGMPLRKSYFRENCPSRHAYSVHSRFAISPIFR